MCYTYYVLALSDLILRSMFTEINLFNDFLGYQKKISKKVIKFLINWNVITELQSGGLQLGRTTIQTGLRQSKD